MKYPGLKEGKPGVVPEYNEKCIDIAAKGAIRELIPARASWQSS